MASPRQLGANQAQDEVEGIRLSKITAKIIADRIEQAREAAGIKTQKELALAVGIHPNSYSEKALAAGRNRFSYDDIGKIADYLRQVTGKRLEAWPWVDQDVSDAVDAVIALTSRQKK